MSQIDTPKPRITVATIVERKGRFLMVSERSGGRVVYNQPAGHVEIGETLLQAALRETYEETRWRVALKGVLGISHFTSPNNGRTYIRHSFVAEALEEDKEAFLDPDIEAVHWLSYEDIVSRSAELRSPVVLHDLRRHRTGKTYSLALIEGFI